MDMFPIVDISYAMENYSSDEKPSHKFLTDINVNDICNELHNAFNKWGFIYLKGHGICNTFVQHTFNVAQNYFELPTSTKNKLLLASPDPTCNIGYVPFKYETFDNTKPFDLKEAFDYLPWINDKERQKLPLDFITMLDDFYGKCQNVSLMLFRLINQSLRLDDHSFIENAHHLMGQRGNTTILRSLYYPGVEEKNIQSLQGRCGEHTDYGSLTLLFQDATGGLEVESPSGEFVHVIPIQDTIVVNAADLLERWTSGIKSTKHRVTLPKDTTKARQSFAFFCQPDDNMLIQCLDGSNKYEPVTSLAYIHAQFKKTYSQVNK